MSWEKDEVKKLLKACITTGTRVNVEFKNNDFLDISNNLHSSLKDCKIVPKKSAEKREYNTDPFVCLGSYFTEFKKKYNKGVDFESAVNGFLNHFEWHKERPFSIYTLLPQTRDFCLDEVPTQEALNVMQAHFTGINAGIPSNIDYIWLQLKKHGFEESQNPIYILDAFLMARQMGIYPPVWAIDYLTDIFEKLNKSPTHVSLDVLFGLKGDRQGNRSIGFKYFAERERDEIVTKDVYLLTTFFDCTLEEACRMAVARLKSTKDFNKSGFKIKTDLSWVTIKDKYTHEWKKVWAPLFAESTQAIEDYKEWFKRNKKKYLLNFPKDSIPDRLKS